MYQFPYADILADDLQNLRQNEEEAFTQVIDKLDRAEEAGPGSVAAAEALYYTDRLWKILLDDLSHPENALPNELKANLISIGIWMLKEVETVRTAPGKSVRDMIEINKIIREGLR